MKKNLEQWQLNTILGVVAAAVIVLVVSSLLGKSPMDIMSWFGNLVVYLFFLLGFEIVLPVLIGFLVRLYPLEWLDSSFGRKPSERISSFLNLVCAVMTGLLLAICWLWLTRLIAQIPSLSVWPAWDTFKWRSNSESINWPVACASAILGALGYWGGLMAADDLHKNDSTE